MHSIKEFSFSLKAEEAFPQAPGERGDIFRHAFLPELSKTPNS